LSLFFLLLLQETIFADLVVGQSAVQLNAEELEAYFAAPVSKAAASAAASVTQAPTKKKVKPVVIVEAKKAQLVNILLGSYRISVDDVRQLLLALNPKTLNLEMTEQLMQAIPSPEDWAKVIEYQRKNFDLNRLGAPENLVLALANVPLCNERLFAHAMKMSFQTRVDTTKPRVEVMRNACKQMRESALWRRVLSNVLAIGNFLNAGASRGQAVGIKLDSLLKIGDTRSSSSKKINALHYLIEHLEKTDPTTLGFALELNAVPFAAKIELASLAAEVKSLSDMVGRVKFALDKVPANLDGDKDKLAEVLNANSVSQYQALLNALRSDVAALHVDWAGVARSYGEDEKQLQSTEFFAMIVQFIQQFEEARKVRC
jgi:diaphanous 1